MRTTVPRTEPGITSVAVDARTAERILVLDDEENMRETLSEFLGMSGYEVDVAPDGSSGIEQLGRQDYDLVLTDLKMPGMDGIALTEWMRETHPDVPVILMTGYATVDTTIRALRLGASDYVLKPFTLDEMQHAVSNCLERRRLQRRNTELTAMNDRLLEIERIKDDLLATVSHEFRTPLTSMKGFLMLLDQFGLDNLRPDQAQAIDAIRVNVDRLDVMIGNLLMLVECQDGAYKPILEPVDIGGFLNEYIRTLEVARLGRNAGVEIDASVRGTRVLLDTVRFPLVLANLLDNAWKFAREATEPRVLIRLRREGDQVVLEIHDDGIGVAESLGDRIFDRFAQADMTSTREHSGAGLGLAVVRKLLSAHDGTVRLVPPVMGGTSVRVTLPAAATGTGR